MSGPRFDDDRDFWKPNPDELEVEWPPPVRAAMDQHPSTFPPAVEGVTVAPLAPVVGTIGSYRELLEAVGVLHPVGPAVGPDSGPRIVHDIVIRVDVDAKVAHALPGGTRPRVDPDQPVTGLDLVLGQAHEAAASYLHGYLTAAGLDPQLSAPDGGVRFVETFDRTGSEF